ncbi:MAG: DUF2169 domain-containing protein [Deltaproteobacteria bacterium]|nr:DUF2169 domain-containing protein [Myxococcales bacterium]MDP3214095.1 DUF2169 domain-containing protein [Deltaproteobacteria bacterium]
MELVNRTALPAACGVGDGWDDDHQAGVVTAKATFTYEPGEGLALDTQSPLPLFDDDEPTRWGVIPRDDLPREGDDFEVIFLGCAHAPRGAAVGAMEVSLSVGDVERRLAVFGRRCWTDDAPGAPEAFRAMPLTWQNAFGGACEALVDRDAPVILADARNPAGKGFDPAPQARALGEFLRCPAGYPSLDPSLELPNVESPEHLVRRRDDAPEPASWATLPLASAAHARRMFDLERSESDGRPVFTEQRFHRAVPGWVIPAPGEGAEVVMRGLDPAGEVRFTLPTLRVWADFDVGGARTTVALAPQTMVILGEKRTVTVTYRAHIHLRRVDEVEKSVRLRVEQP